MTDSARPQVTIYSDGGCSPNPGPGGWAAILRCSDIRLEKEICGYEAETTNNRMELTAALRALELLRRPCAVTLVTDSRYLADAFRQGWLEKWKRNGWLTSGKEPVKNQDLWRQLDALLACHAVTWQWIPGHSGHPENERCDALVTLVRERRGV